MGPMVDHMSVNVSDVERSAAFYDAALSTIGYARAMDFTMPDGNYRAIGYGPRELPAPEDGHLDPAFWIGGRGGKAAGSGPHIVPSNGFHVAFHAENRAAVDAFHKAGLAHGGTDNGAPGLRPHYHENYYAAFVIDPDGYHVEAVCHKPENT